VREAPVSREAVEPRRDVEEMEEEDECRWRLLR
jgi:hypothetical protein